MGAVTAGRAEPGWRSSFASLRPDGYALLAALLGKPPTQRLLRTVQSLAWAATLPDGLGRALAQLRLAAAGRALAAVEVEYARLFVGLGSGEVVPYASWYREGTLLSRPLAALRSDLLRLGIVRQAAAGEPEDHAGALCEVMALLSATAAEAPLAQQAQVFADHVAPWMAAFFRDLQTARSADFYRAAGDFGGCFLEAEARYLAVAPGQDRRTEGAEPW